uniref:Uncharacterized protein n=1 Tax=Rhizophora mucronata TaxID=61149 RepID=A0A2P2LCD4_RHIMU
MEGGISAKSHCVSLNDLACVDLPNNLDNASVVSRNPISGNPLIKRVRNFLVPSKDMKDVVLPPSSSS